MLWRVVALNVLLAASLWNQAYAYPALWVALTLGLVAGSSLAAVPAAGAAAAGWLLGTAMAPQWVWLPTFYNEPNYLQLLADGGLGWVAWLVGAAATAILGYGLASLDWKAVHRRRLGLALAALMVVNLVPRLIAFSPQLIDALDSEPADKSYHFDGQQHLKIVYLMKRLDYYRAYGEARQRDQRTWEAGYPHESIRTPVVFWIWAHLPAGRHIAYLGWAMALLTMFSAYLVLGRRSDPILALGAPALLGSFLAYPLMNWWIMYPDFWAAMVCTLALLAWLSSRLLAAAPLALLAVLIREFAALDIAVFGILAVAYRRRRETVVWALVTLAVIFIYLRHMGVAHATLGMSGSGMAANRFQGSAGFCLATLRFGCILLAGRDLWMPVLAVLCLSAPKTLPDRRLGWALALIVGIHLLTFCWVGIEYAQYYGFSYIPTVLFGGACVIAGARDAQAAQGSDRPQPEGSDP